MASAPIRLAILGSTGSIGHSALAVVDAHADRLQVIGLAAGTSAPAMALQVERYRPRAVVMATDAACETLRAQLPTGAAANLDLCGAGPQAGDLIAACKLRVFGCHDLSIALSFLRSPSSSAVSHSQRVTTRQPRCSSSSRTRLSRATLLLNFCRQKSTFDLGE